MLTSSAWGGVGVGGGNERGTEGLERRDQLERVGRRWDVGLTREVLRSKEARLSRSPRLATDLLRV